MVAKGLVTGGALAAAMLVTATAAQADCKFEKIAEVPVTMQGMRPYVQTKLNGKDAVFAVDTGAEFSAISEDAVASYGLHHSSTPFGLSVRGLGGAQRDARAATADTFSFAGAGFRSLQFLVGGRTDGKAAGFIGQNLTGSFDVEYDLAHGMIRIFKAQGCGRQNLAYWSSEQHVSKVDLIDPGVIVLKPIIDVQLNGHTVRAMLDTGTATLVNLPGAARAGIQPNSPGVTQAGVMYGAFGGGNELYRAPFDSVKIGDEEVKNTQLHMARLATPDTDMQLGVDFFLSHRVLISNSQKAVYFTYNGGPIFRLDGPANARPQQVAADSPPAGVPTATATSAPSEAGDAPKTAAEFLRRGAAFAARREFQRAIADDNQALVLEPENASAYRARALARMAMGQPVLAMADLDETLKRQPDDADALVRRGGLYLATRDPIRAKADFDAAMKLSPGNSRLPAMAGMSYAQAGLYDEAISQLDSWLAAHPHDEDVGQALTSRCYARAASGRDLDKALADCDAALRKDRSSNTMQVRALALLRLNRLDDAIAQYSAAIKAQPRDAVALYGRGLAELKKGDKGAGDADIAAATGIAQNVGAQFKRMGLGPGADTASSKS